MTINIKQFLPAVLTATFVLAATHANTSYAQDARIIAMGDSITAGVRGQCGYRRVLSQNMLNNPSCNVDFVGPIETSSGDASEANCVEYDTDHAAVSGRRADQFTLGRIGTWSNTYNPTHFLVHVGSNDIFAGEEIEQIIDDINLIRARIADRAPGAVMLLANLIPWDPVSPNPSFGSFDTEAVDELAQSAALSAAIDNYVSTLNSPLVRLVDVRSGFDNRTMTIDGLHPNDLGEAHIASRFQQVLEQVGVCNVVPLPTKTMVQNQWYQLALPANPNGANTVREIFDNLPAGQYGSTWQLYSWNPNQSGSPRQYTDPGIDGEMMQGRGYWAIQTVSPSVVIDMPAEATLTQLRGSSECTSDAGCYRVRLTSERTPFIDPVRGSFDWDMVGFPHFQSTRFSDTRITTPATGPCSGAEGCTPAEASANQVMNNAIIRWNGAANAYDTITGDSPLLPWDGLWVPILGQGADGNSRWIVAPE